jgi:hypothetical protein
LLKRYESIAKERIRHTFISFNKYGCVWTWDWTSRLEPKKIRGSCEFCGQPIYSYFAKGPIKKSERPEDVEYVGIYCSSGNKYECGVSRAYFEITTPQNANSTPEEIMQHLIGEEIISERSRRTAKEIKILRWQFWR